LLIGGGIVQCSSATGPFHAEHQPSLRELATTSEPRGFVDFTEACYSWLQKKAASMIENPRIPLTSVHRVEADGVSVFYRQSGPADAPVVLLLHGFPTSLFQYRELIPRLADRYRIIAPDLPGFGFTVVPEERRYKYTFDSLAKTTLAFTDALDLTKYAVYIFDYGAPTGLRVAMQRPERVTAIVSQNGNAYEEGLGDVSATPRLPFNAIGVNLLPTAGNCTVIDGQTGTSAPALKITNPIREDAVEKLYIRL